MLISQILKLFSNYFGISWFHYQLSATKKGINGGKNVFVRFESVFRLIIRLKKKLNTFLTGRKKWNSKVTYLTIIAILDIPNYSGGTRTRTLSLTHTHSHTYVHIHGRAHIMVCVCGGAMLTYNFFKYANRASYVLATL